MANFMSPLNRPKYLMNLMKKSRLEAHRAYMPKYKQYYIHIYKFINYYNEICKYMVVPKLLLYNTFFMVQSHIFIADFKGVSL